MNADVKTLGHLIAWEPWIALWQRGGVSGRMEAFIGLGVLLSQEDVGSWEDQAACRVM